MKISIVQGPYYPVPALLNTGAEKVWYGLGAEFARRGHDVLHISRRYPGLPDKAMDVGVEHIRVTSRGAPRMPLWYRAYDLIYSLRVLRVLPRGRDIVITNCMWLPLLLRRGCRGKIYIHVARYPKGQMWIYKHADRLQAVSQAVAEAIRAEIPDAAARIGVIPPYLSNDPPPLSDAAITRRNKRILYVGRIHPEKGLDILIGAVRNLKLADWELNIVGSWEVVKGGGGEAYMTQLRKLAGENVNFRGSISQSELNSCYNDAAILVYPSIAERGESFGMVPLEAMACGCAVIVSDLQCFRDFILPGVTGYVFNHRPMERAVAALQAALSAAIADPEARSKVAKAGYRKAQEFRKEAVAAKYLADFEQLIRG